MESKVENTGDSNSSVDALTRVVQAVYTQINTWRERMPHKYENIEVWHSILGGRNIVYENMKKRMVQLL